MGHGPTSRRLMILLLVACLFLFFIFNSFRGLAQRAGEPVVIKQDQRDDSLVIQAYTLNGNVIASRLGNETAKADLGRSAWKLFHTTFARFPDNPTADESLALKSYIYLFQRLYPCGECATHFRQILDKFPPQVSSRSTVAAWGCHVHNEVNKALKKPIFDCADIGDFYDCGCADDVAEEEKEKSDASKEKSEKTIAPDERKPVQLKQEEYQRGG